MLPIGYFSINQTVEKKQANMGGHTFPWKLVRAWKIPITIGALSFGIMVVTFTETWYYNYHLNKIMWQEVLITCSFFTQFLV